MAFSCTCSRNFQGIFIFLTCTFYNINETNYTYQVYAVITGYFKTSSKDSVCNFHSYFTGDHFHSTKPKIVLVNATNFNNSLSIEEINLNFYLVLKEIE